MSVVPVSVWDISTKCKLIAEAVGKPIQRGKATYDCVDRISGGDGRDVEDDPKHVV